MMMDGSKYYHIQASLLYDYLNTTVSKYKVNLPASTRHQNIEHSPIRRFTFFAVFRDTVLEEFLRVQRVADAGYKARFDVAAADVPIHAFRSEQADRNIF